MGLGKSLGWALLPLLAACASQPQASPTPAASALSAEEAQRVRTAAQQVLFWNQEQRDRGFRTMHQLFPVVRVAAGGKARPLPAGEPIESDLGGAAAVDRLMAAMNASGLLILQDGRIRLERYARGHGPSELWTSFSVAKSLTSTLVGAAVKDGYIKSLDDPVTRYIPELAGSAYEGVTVRHILTMTSGVRWNEDYTDPKSDVARMFAAAPPPGEDVTVAYLKRLPREAPPGTKWVYKTGETNLIGVLVRRATGKPLSRYLSEKVWRPYGMEADAFWQIDERGQEVAGCCLSMRLRDYGRVGQFILDGGRAGGKDVLPAGWIAEATRAHADIGAPGRGYGYQWWTGPNGTFMAIGIFGQMIYLDPARRLVLVTSGAASQATGRELTQARFALVAAVTAALAKE
jgi:CubicO group peptidase (beta-lactamase class C family)